MSCHGIQVWFLPTTKPGRLSIREQTVSATSRRLEGQAATCHGGKENLIKRRLHTLRRALGCSLGFLACACAAATATAQVASFHLMRLPVSAMMFLSFIRLFTRLSALACAESKLRLTVGVVLSECSQECSGAQKYDQRSSYLLQSCVLNV